MSNIVIRIDADYELDKEEFDALKWAVEAIHDSRGESIVQVDTVNTEMILSKGEKK